ncbi:MAG TPA: glycosyl hydrolase 53 family protein [Fimbriimonadaceae bacterium]|nr:glycosyl hydrolase 53 family protein [Fimbriimonadaceae bacterium]HRJ33102.1 glycosyl hydrolase 53 family protein [Fimbriimonadaceae bacterium]
MMTAIAWVVLAESRPFRMGFTPWPSEMSEAGLTQARRFMEQNGDLTAIMFLGGIPWQEALENKPFSADVQKQLAYRPPPGTKVFLSISPLAMSRKDLAPYWGEKDNMPLPPEWRNAALDDAKVVLSFSRFVIRSVEALRPEYLAIGVESNAMLTYDRTKWPAYKRLHTQAYRNVKTKFPKLPIFFTTEVNHYLGRSMGSNATDQEREVGELMKQSDWFAMSYYPHMTLATPWPIPSTALDFAKKFRKPIAMSETGMNSQPAVFPQVTLPGSPEMQDQYYQVLLDAAQRDRYQLIVNFCTTDFEKLVAVLPPGDRELASIWTYSGLQTSSGQLKPAGKRWQSTFARPFRR